MKSNKQSSKKAQLSTLQTLIIVLICVVIGLMLTRLIYDYLAKSSSLERCRTSVIAASNLKAFGKSFMTLDCPREQLIIKESNVKRGSFIDENKIDKYIAEEMRKCWYKMGEGKLNSFQNNFLQGDIACLICTEISFDSNLVQKRNNISSLKNYLQTTQIKNMNQTYASYIYNEYSSSVLDTDQKFVFYLNEKGRWNDTISLSGAHNKYVVYYVASKSFMEQAFPIFLAGMVGGASGGMAGYGAGAATAAAMTLSENPAAVVLVDQDAFNQNLKCTYIYN